MPVVYGWYTQERLEKAISYQQDRERHPNRTKMLARGVVYTQVARVQDESVFLVLYTDGLELKYTREEWYIEKVSADAMHIDTRPETEYL